MEKSKLLALDWKDIIKSAVLVIITGILTSVYQVLESGDIATLLEWEALKPIILTSISSGVAYLMKNFLTNSSDQVLKKE